MTATSEAVHLPVLAVDERSHLRPLSVTDASAFLQLVQDNRERLGEYEPWPYEINSFRDAVTHLSHAEGFMREGTRASFGIALGAKGSQDAPMVGIATLHSRDVAGEDTAYLGYWVTKSHNGEQIEGGGYARRSSERLLRWGFNDWGLNRVKLYIDPSNTASQWVATRLGARLLPQLVLHKGRFVQNWEVTQS